ncbi:MAG: pyridoxal-phosphate dependent enzyme [Actinobacteria bacterium]|nr:pyridoxal-phosphate dependent enzyme [Actinomycetota bacterium]
MATDLDLARIEEASRTADPAFRDSPQFICEPLCDALGRQVVVKLEMANPLGSFKGRGASFLVRSLPAGSTVVGASSGNLGVALAYAARARGMSAHLYVPPGTSPARLARMRGLGAGVTVTGGDAARAARAHVASRPGCVLANNHPAVAEGAGAIGVELLRAGRLDAVVLPVSDGTLISGVGRWVKARSPATRIIGVCPAAAPAVALSWQAGRVVRADPGSTIADGLATAEPAPEAVHRMRQVVDDMVLVPDSALLDAMRLAARTLGVLIEPSAAAGLAAIACHDVPGTTLATVLTGTDPGSPALAEALGDGLPRP